MNICWGLLGPGQVSSERRVRTLGLGAVVRRYNDLAVPGLGGVWFGKQLLLAILGVAVACRVRSCGKPAKNIETTNAVEALACLLALQSNGQMPDSRLRGGEKLRGKKDCAFSILRRPGFYVSQPMRMATVQALPELGLVEPGPKMFNSFQCTQAGLTFIESACVQAAPCYYTKSVLDVLCDWAQDLNSAPSGLNRLSPVLSPLVPLEPSAREFLKNRLCQGSGVNAQRRKAALNWVESLVQMGNQAITWDRKPTHLTDEHWRDLQSGAAFFQTRDAALNLLNATEAYLDTHTTNQCLRLDGTFPAELEKSIYELRLQAEAFLALPGDNSPEGIATKFCQACLESDPARALGHLAERDERCLKLRDGVILPGPAYRGSQAFQSLDVAHEEGQAELPQVDLLPPGISPRIYNLFRLRLDLNGELDAWLNPAQELEDSNV